MRRGVVVFSFCGVELRELVVSAREQRPEDTDEGKEEDDASRYGNGDQDYNACRKEICRAISVKLSMTSLCSTHGVARS